MNPFENADVTSLLADHRVSSLATDFRYRSVQEVSSGSIVATKDFDQAAAGFESFDAVVINNQIPKAFDYRARGMTDSFTAVNRCKDSVLWWIRQTGQPLAASSDCNSHLNNSNNVSDAVCLWNIGPGTMVYKSSSGNYMFSAGISLGRAFMFKLNQVDLNFWTDFSVQSDCLSVD